MVVHTVNAISDEASGPSYSVRRLCESLIDQGQEVTLATLDWSPMSSPPQFLRRFPLAAGPRRLGRSTLMKKWLFEQACARSMKLIHMHGLWMMPGVYPGKVALKFGIPLLAAPRGTFSAYAFRSGSLLKRAFWWLAQKPALEAVSCFHATAEAEYHDIRRMGFKQPVAIIPNAVDIPPDQPKKNAGLRTLLYLGRLHHEKGVDTLLKAWCAVHEKYSNWQLRLVGPDIRGYQKKLETLAARLGLRRIVFAGPLYGEDKQRAYREAELYVLPSPSENFGMAVAEALAVGTPAITTKGAPWQGLEIKKAGWWVNPDPDSLGACLEQALALSCEDLAAMGWRGRQWMQEEFSWKEVAQKTTETYGWLLQGGTSPAWIRKD